MRSSIDVIRSRWCMVRPRTELPYEGSRDPAPQSSGGTRDAELRATAGTNSRGDCLNAIGGSGVPGKNILIVDDEVAVRETLAGILRDAGYVVDLAATV